MITLTRAQLAMVAVPLLALLAVAGSRLAGVGASEGPTSIAPLARIEPGAGAAAPRLFVHVVGAVRRPGLFRLKEGARVADALTRAGGPTKRADLSAVNLAAPLADGQQVVVPRRVTGGAAGTAPAGTAAGAASGVKVSLASATVEQLDELPGIGPVTAQKIVDWRTAHGPFRSVEDLDDVPGIGPARIEQLRDLVTP
ncbi:MAG: helix-hairpin-helix domain-containing protein [Gaiella sp.]|nr:helix-hairpin-helix domain-containing protein [Gaiella sp.]